MIHGSEYFQLCKQVGSVLDCLLSDYLNSALLFGILRDASKHTTVGTLSQLRDECVLRVDVLM